MRAQERERERASRCWQAKSQTCPTWGLGFAGNTRRPEARPVDQNVYSSVPGAGSAGAPAGTASVSALIWR